MNRPTHNSFERSKKPHPANTPLPYYGSEAATTSLALPFRLTTAGLRGTRNCTGCGCSFENDFRNARPLATPRILRRIAMLIKLLSAPIAFLWSAPSTASTYASRFGMRSQRQSARPSGPAFRARTQTLDRLARSLDRNHSKGSSGRDVPAAQMLQRRTAQFRPLLRILPIGKKCSRMTVSEEYVRRAQARKGRSPWI
jgi:hypothetical protein